MMRTNCPTNRRPSILPFRALSGAARSGYVGSAVALLCLLSQSLGCSSSGIDEEPLTEGSFLEAYVEETCSRASDCCSVAEVGYNASYCRDSALAQVQGVKTSLEERGEPWEFHPAEAQRCLEEMKGQPRDCSVLIHGSACSDVYRGTYGLGKACRQQSECALAEVPEAEGHTACGRFRGGSGEGAEFCQLVVTTREVGEECDVPTGPPGSLAVVETCKQDGFCHRGFCMERSQAGGKCPCMDGLLCGADDTCVPKGPLGTSCDVDDDCESRACGDDGTCHGIGEAIRYSLCVEHLPY
jgi:hypothetical protein